MKRALAVAAVPLVFVAAHLAVPSARSAIFTTFERDFDEGGNVMKALLVMKGDDLYAQIWSDQPPVFTHVLAAAFRVAGTDVAVARLVVLAFATLLLVCAMRVVARGSGAGAGFAAAGLIALSPRFFELSSSVLIGLPAIALALAALDAAFSARARASLPVSSLLAVLGGTLLGAGALTKLFVLPLGAVVVGLFAVERRWRQAALFAASSAVVVGAGLASMGELGRRMITAPHIAAQGAALGLDVSALLAPTLPLLALAALAIVGAGRRREWSALALGAWCVLDVVAVTLESPRWEHHILLVGVPAALVAGPVVERAFSEMLRRAAGPVAVMALALAVAVAAVFIAMPPKKAPPAEDDAVAALRALKVDHVLTDRPMVAFRAGAVVPGLIAVTSVKRSQLDDLDGAFELLVNSEHPAAVHVSRFHFVRYERALTTLGYTPHPLSVGTLWLRSAAP